MNVFQLFANAAMYRSEACALRHGTRSATYTELAAQSAAFGAGLIAAGVNRGDRVVIYLRNGFEYPVALFGLFHAGIVAVPVNVKLHPREAAYIIEHCGAVAVVVDADAEDAVVEALPENVRPRMIAVGRPDGPGSFEACVHRGGSMKTPPAEVAPDDTAWIFYTSGTTGRPKGAMLSHRSLIAMSVNCLADIYRFGSDDRVLHAAPLSHGSGVYLIPALAGGSENIIFDHPSFDPDAVLSTIAREKITSLAFVAPTMIVRLLDGDARHDTSSLRSVIYGGAPIHIEHIQAAVRRFGPIFVQLYGQGEAPMTISVLPARDHLSNNEEVLSSAGYVRTGVDVAILDEHGTAQPAGTPGEIAVRGDIVMTGYWKNPEATAAALDGGWLRTGDIGLFDAGGRLHLLDRRHDTIISGGSNIYPREIEDVLVRHPSVKEAIVFGLPDKEWGESVAAAVVLREDALSVTGDELIAFCREHLASFKKPKSVRILPELPKNAYGKVLRRELKARFGGQNF
jgi:acyl-CoA synthetase (AMP-forming)/AMP-acid ligase II